MKDADSGTRLKPGHKQPSEAPPPPEPGHEHRAEPGSAQHRANQHELGVDEQHRTDEMRQEQRGTYP